MTEKQKQIIQAALKLFAEEGYNATSTSKVAKYAGVSEGLIFRHFKNKEGLLHAIMEQGKQRAQQLFSTIIFETDPKEVIRKTIELPFKVVEKDHEFWRLQFKLKWEIKHYHQEKLEPLYLALKNAFSKLGYENPEMEAEYIIIYIEGFSSAILKNTITNKNELRKFVLSKYYLLDIEQTGE